MSRRTHVLHRRIIVRRASRGWRAKVVLADGSPDPAFEQQQDRVHERDAETDAILLHRRTGLPLDVANLTRMRIRQAEEQQIALGRARHSPRREAQPEPSSGPEAA